MSSEVEEAKFGRRAPAVKKSLPGALSHFEQTHIDRKRSHRTVTGFGLVVAVVSLFLSLASLLGLVVAALGLAVAAHGASSLFRPQKGVSAKLHAPGLDFDAVVARTKPARSTEEVRTFTYKDGSARDRVGGIVRDPDVDRWLRQAPNVRLRKDRLGLRRVHRFLSHHSQIAMTIVRERNSKPGVEFKNETKVSLGCDVVKGMKDAWVWKTSYWLTGVTNDQVLFDIEAVSDEDVGYVNQQASEFYKAEILDRSGCLTPLAGSRLSNHIGSNTIAITTDGYAQLWIQGGDSAVSRNLLAATGSGSVDWSDRVGQNDLLALAIEGANRELLEETRRARAVMQPNWIGETKVVGFFRNLNRGGLPGFLAITRMNVESGRLEPNEAEVQKVDKVNRRLGEEQIETLVPASSLEEFRASLEKLMVLNRLSVPLFAHVVCLLEAIDEDPAFFEDFFEYP